MIIGKVLETLRVSKKDENLIGTKLVAIRRVDENFKEQQEVFVAADAIGSKQNEIVLVATGCALQHFEAIKNKPIDALIVGVLKTGDK